MTVEQEAHSLGFYVDDWLYEKLRARRGRTVAVRVLRIRNGAPAHVPDERAWQWAEEKHDERDLAEHAGTGYDPDDEFRWLGLER